MRGPATGWLLALALLVLAGCSLPDGDESAGLRNARDGGAARRSWILPPLAYHREDSGGWLTLTPIWSGGRKGEARWSAVLPVYYHRSDPAAGKRLLATPLVVVARSPKETRWIVVPLGSGVWWGRNEGEMGGALALWLAGYERSGDQLEHHVLPFYWYSRKGDETCELNVLWLLVTYERLKRGWTGLTLLGASQDPWGWHEDVFRAWWPSWEFWWGGAHKEIHFRVFPFFEWNEWVPKGQRPAEAPGAGPRTRGWWFAPSFLPLIMRSHEADGSWRFTILWGLLFRSARSTDGGREVRVLLVPVLRRDGESSR